MKAPLTIRMASLAVAGVAATALAPQLSASAERQFLYCVSSAAAPGGKAYFSHVYPGTWDQSADDEEGFYRHVSQRVDEGVERGTTYCYALDTFDEAGLDRAEGIEVVRKGGWDPVDITWRP